MPEVLIPWVAFMVACPEFPGESRALAEVFGLGKCTLKRSPLSPWMSYTTREHIAG